MPRSTKFDYLTADDWKGLSSAGVTKRIIRSGASVYDLDSAKVDAVLIQALLDRAQVESAAEFAEQGLTIPELVYHHLKLPNVPRTAPVDKKTGDPDENWVDPYRTVADVVTRRLRTGHTNTVQAAMLRKGLILFNGLKNVEVTIDDGLLTTEKRTAHAVTQTVEVIEEFITDPSVAETLRKAKLQTAHWGALTDAVPEAAGTIIGALATESQVVDARREAVFTHVVAALSPEQRAALEAELADLAGASEPVNLEGTLSLPGGSSESAA